MKGITHFARTKEFYLKLLGAGLLLLMLGLTAGCGEDGFICTSDGCTSVSNDPGTTTGGGTTQTTSGIQIGNGTGTAFQVGILAVDNTALTTGGSANVSVSLVNDDQSAYATSTEISFSTSCSSSTINPSPTSTSGGIANAVYIAGSCAGTDTITASATVEGTALTATGNVTITVPAVNILFGSGSGVSFVQNSLELGTGNVGAGQMALSAGGSTSIIATVVDGDNSNALYTAAPVSVSLSSPCTGAGTAVIDTPVSTVNGVAQTTYIASGCAGDDLITATAVINGNVVNATATINVAPASVGSIQFASATPEVIALAGTGGGGLQETSTLIFKVVDNNGDPVPNQIVNFALNTNVGGISLSSISGVTISDGTVSTIVQSGTISTPVKVTATTTDVNSGITYTTQSDALVVSTGLADQNSFSLSLSDCNPAGAWETDNVTVSVNVLAADHFNNPVPDGTAISFTTEGGSIDGSCLTDNGACSVTWRSQNPRPADSRVTILATAIGNESFLDANSNGGYDDGDPLFDAQPNPGNEDLPEAWRDDNEDGVFNAGSEEFVDFNQDGVYTAADGGYTGVLCNHSSDCAAATSLHVRRLHRLGMASNSNTITIGAIPTLPVSTGTPVDVTISVQSITGQYPATGTTISVATTNGSIEGTASWTVPNTCGTALGASYDKIVSLLGDGTASTGKLTVTVTTNGITTEKSVNVTDVDDAP
jgi:hypothetical protein